jgi:transcriptional antiterminator RfaH
MSVSAEKCRFAAAKSLPNDACGFSIERLWYVVKTKPREERICVREMERQGIETLCPMTREFRFRRRKQEVVPLFPGYIFVRFAFPDEYNNVRWLKGVSSLVRFGSNDPPAVDGNEVALFIERMDEDGVIDTSPELVEGQKVQFLSEPMRGMIGTILKCESAQSRVRVLMDLLYQATVEVESYQVKGI